MEKKGIRSRPSKKAREEASYCSRLRWQRKKWFMISLLEKSEEKKKTAVADRKEHGHALK